MANTNPSCLKLTNLKATRGDYIVNIKSFKVEAGQLEDGKVKFDISFDVDNAKIEKEGFDADNQKLKTKEVTYLEIQKTDDPNIYEMDIKQLPTLTLTSGNNGDASNSSMNLLLTTLNYYLGDDGIAGIAGSGAGGGGNAKPPGTAGINFGDL